MTVRPELSIIENSVIPESCRVMPFTNIYSSILGEFVFVGPFVELGGCTIGNFTKISSHSYIPPHVSIGNHCFIAHSVCFCNDAFTDPEEYTSIDELSKGWKILKTKVGDCVRIGSGAIILPGVKIGDNAVIGAGAVVTKDVPPSTVVAGVPARAVRKINEWGFS